MTTTFSELRTMHDSLSGGTTNLLRMARSGCGCAVAFVALALEDRTFATARYSSTPDEGLVGREALDELVGQIWQEPELRAGTPMVRSVRLGGAWMDRTTTPLSVAVVPLGDTPGAEPWGMVGVADPGVRSFSPSELELLERIAQRMASYLRARHEVQQHVPEGVTFGAVPASVTPAPERPATPAPATPAPATRPVGPTRQAAQEAEPVEPGRRSELWWAVEPEAAPHQPPAPASTTPASTTPTSTTPTSTTPTSTTWAALAAEAAGALGRPLGHERPPTAEATPSAPASATFEPPAPEPATPSPAEAAPRAGVPPVPAPSESGSAGVGTTAEPDSFHRLLGDDDLPPGLVPVGALLGRTGRLLGAGGATSGSLAVVAMEIDGVADAAADLVPAAVSELRALLRFDDPLARIGRTSFVAVVPLAPGGSSGELVEARLAEALRAATAGYDAQIRSAHVVADIRASHDADELLRSAVGKLRAD